MGRVSPLAQLFSGFHEKRRKNRSLTLLGMTKGEAERTERAGMEARQAIGAHEEPRPALRKDSDGGKRPGLALVVGDALERKGD
jgi:hypothetical protein